jgi:transcriptional regulator GlxA family with amidase domain
MRNVGIFIFDEVEVLDFAGPFEVFNVTGKRTNLDAFNTFTISETERPVKARGALEVKAHFHIGNHPKLDILLVPGGYGTRALLGNENVLGWIKQQAETVEHLLSVCTGALVLGKAGLLDGLQAVTHHGAVALLKEVAPTATVLDERYVDNGRIILSAGVAAGIDMSFYVVAKLLGPEAARETAEYIEYPLQA